MQNPTAAAAIRVDALHDEWRVAATPAFYRWYAAHKIVIGGSTMPPGPPPHLLGRALLLWGFFNLPQTQQCVIDSLEDNCGTRWVGARVEHARVGVNYLSSRAITRQPVSIDPRLLGDATDYTEAVFGPVGVVQGIPLAEAVLAPQPN